MSLNICLFYDGIACSVSVCPAGGSIDFLDRHGHIVYYYNSDIHVFLNPKFDFRSCNLVQYNAVCSFISTSFTSIINVTSEWSQQIIRSLLWVEAFP